MINQNYKEIQKIVYKEIVDQCNFIKNSKFVCYDVYASKAKTDKDKKWLIKRKKAAIKMLDAMKVLRYS